MKKRKYHKNLIRLIILIIGIFIFAPCYLNALPLPTGDSTTTINASAIGEPQFKPPVLALENTQISATEIEEIFDILRDPAASEKIKQNALGKLYQIISDATVDIALKESIADGLLNIFGDSVLSEGLNFKIPSFLKAIVLTPDVSQEKQMAIATGLLNALTDDNFSFNLKRGILGTVYSFLSAKDNAGEFLIPLNIREAAVDLLLAAFNKADLISAAEEDMLLKNMLLKDKIVSLLRRAALTFDISTEKRSQIVTALLSALTSELYPDVNDKKGILSVKKNILSTAYSLLIAQDSAGEFLISLDIREAAVDLLLAAFNKEDLVSIEYSATLKSQIESLLNSNFPESGPTLKNNILGLIGNNPDYNAILKSKIASLLKRVALAPNFSPEKQKNIVTALLNSLSSDHLSFSLKRQILGSVYYFLSAKTKPKTESEEPEFILPAYIREIGADLLPGILQKPNLVLTVENTHLLKRIIVSLSDVKAEDKDALLQEIKSGLSNKITTDNTALKNRIVAFLKSSVLNFKISEAKQRQVAIGLLNALLNNSSEDYNLDFDLKRKILEVTHYFLVAKNADKGFIVPVDIKEDMADLLIDAYKKTKLDDTPANNDTLKGQAASLLKRIVLIHQIDPATKTKIVDELFDSLINNAFSNTVKKYSVVGALNSLLVNKEKIGEPEEPIVALNLKEQIIKWLLEKKILNHQNIVDRVEKDKKDKNGNVIKDKNGNVIKEIEYEVREPLVNLFKSAVLISNLDVDTKKQVVDYLITSIDSLKELPELVDKVLVALKNIGTGNAVDTEKIRTPILNEFLAIYNSRSKRELIASYVAAIGRADATLKEAIATGLALNEEQKKIWNDYNILALNLTRNFIPDELNYIFNVLDALSPKEIDGIIDTVSLFFAINYGGGTAGWNEDNASIGILNGAYNPSNVNGFLKSLCSEIAKAVHPTLTSSSRAKFSDINEFSTLFKEYITDSEALINQAKADAGNAKLLTQVKIIIRIFDYTMEDDATKKVYTFKIENDQINQQEVTLGDDGLPVFSPGA